MSRWTYPADATPADRDQIDQMAGDYGEDERDGHHEQWWPEPYTLDPTFSL